MFRKMVCSLFVMMVAMGLVAAEEFSAQVKEIKDGKVTFYKTTFKDKKLEKGDETTLPVTADVKVANGKVNFKDKKLTYEVGDDIKDGLKNAMFSKIGEKGMNVRITTTDDNKSIKQILVTTFKFDAKDKKKKKVDEKKTDK